jgi:hypothetical protein
MTAFPWEAELAEPEAPVEPTEAEYAAANGLADPDSSPDADDPSGEDGPDPAEGVDDAGSGPATPAVRIETLDAVDRLDEILDTLGASPTDLAITARTMRDGILDVVRARIDRRHKARKGEEATTTRVRAEANGAADDADVLRAFGDAFLAGAKESTQVLGELLDELPGRGGKARQSFKVADAHGLELSVTRSSRTETSVNDEEVVDVLVAYLLATAPARDVALETHPSKVYAAGVRRGIERFVDLLSSPKFKVTALDGFVTMLEALPSAEEGVVNPQGEELAVRLSKAYGRRTVGEPTIKVERKEPSKRERAGGESE